MPIGYSYATMPIYSYDFVFFLLNLNLIRKPQREKMERESEKDK